MRSTFDAAAASAPPQPSLYNAAMDVETVVASKLVVPRPPPYLVPRPRLVATLRDGLFAPDGAFARKLTLLSAPAGFGKTTLLGEWLAAATCPAVCLALDEGDSDPAQFLRHLIAALQRLPQQAALGRPLLAALPLTARAGPAAAPDALLPGLLNDIGAVPTPFHLILDDLHWLAGRPIHDLLRFLLDNLPRNAHLIVSTRADPPWPLARLRARGELAEVRAGGLRFTVAEATAFLDRVVGYALAPPAVAALTGRTEGWIAGLQMAALALRGRDDPDAFINSFSGTHRFIFDYLVEEVLNGQPAAVRQFLLQTSVLERMTASLCDAVTGGDDSQATLADLERANLFLVPLDDRRRWYRYHRLFADLLRSRLQQRGSDQAVALHRRAGAWYEANDLLADAVRHAFAAGDVADVARLVARNAFALMDHGQLRTLVGWLDALPPETVRAEPWLCVARAWALIYTGQMSDLDRLLRDAETTLPAATEGLGGDEEHLRGHIVAIRAYHAALQGDMSGAAALAGEAMERLPRSDLAARSWTASLWANALRWRGQLARADRLFAEADALSRAGGGHVAVDVLADWAGLQMMQGRLHEAAATCHGALQLADGIAARSGRSLPVTGYVHARLSAVMRQWNELDGALRHARESVRLGEAWGWAEMLVGGYVALAEAHRALGDGQVALAVTRKAQRVARDLSPWFDVYAGALAARLHLAQGDAAAAEGWAATQPGLAPGTAPDFHYAFAHLTLAQIRVAQGRLREAMDLLARLQATADEAGAAGLVIESLALQAVALEAQRDDGKAMAALQQALRLAEAEGYVRVFVDRGEPMRRLLGRLIAGGAAAAYAGNLLAALEADAGRPFPSPPAAPVEPLTARELEVLRLLPTPLTSSELAAALTISVNTARTHIKNIYGKLDVHSRAEAVARARELDIL